MSDTPQLPASTDAAAPIRPAPLPRRTRVWLLPIISGVAILLLILVIVGIVIARRGGNDGAKEGVPQTFAAPRAGTQGKINLTASAATVVLHPLENGNVNLLQGSFTPGKGRGNAILQHDGDTWKLSEEDGDKESSGSAAWDIGLASDVALDLTLALDASSADVNLQGLRVAGLKMESNAGTLRLTLPATFDGETKGTITANAGNVQVTTPSSAAVRVVINTRAGSRDLSGRFIEKNGGYETPDYATAKNRLTLTVTAKAGRVTVQ